MLQSCGEIRKDDGIDPREYFRHKPDSNKHNRKALQLCQQVLQTLQLVLTDCDDSLVQSMDLVTVAPNPDSSCVRVHVACGETCSMSEAYEALQRQVSRLRFEISKSIHRKRVPNLVFTITLTNGDDNEHQES